jgi:nitric oxide reductase NorD protein
MEELVGQLWHRLITRAARSEHPEAAVTLQEVRRTIGVVFRALGGDGGLVVEASTPVAHGARRRWLARLAGSGREVTPGWRDARALRLPERIALFPQRALNRELYLWLAALAAQEGEPASGWLAYNQDLTRRALERWPGLAGRYRALVAAALRLRPDPSSLPADEAATERAIRQALEHPGSASTLPPARRAPQPVPLWLHPAPHARPDAPQTADTPAEPAPGGQVHDPQDPRRHRAGRVDAPRESRGLLAARFENILGLAEHASLDRGTEDNQDLAEAARTARDLDRVSVARGGRTLASRIRLDLDLPAPENDDLPLGEGIPLPEWDYRRQTLRPDHCRLQPMVAARATPCALPERLAPQARRLRARFQALAPARAWARARPDGSDLDLDACLRHTAERAAGLPVAGQDLYREMLPGGRDLACLLLADLSLSTDAWVNDRARVVDVVRDSLFLFSEALAATGDPFALYGFSSRHRSHVRFHHIKDFDEPHGPAVRGRIQAIRPGYYTRMGAAIRHASGLLARQSAARRLLLLLTDGKPNDLDHYEGRYGIEDTRMAVHEARRQGLQPFCVTIDRRAGDYLPHLFGNAGYVVVRRAADLSRELPLLYARLSRPL